MNAEVTAAGNVFLNRGWQPFARARSLHGRCTLQFRYNGAATLYVKVFGEDGRRLGCCPEGDSDEDCVHPFDDDDQRGGRTPVVNLPLATVALHSAAAAPPPVRAPTAVAMTNHPATGLGSGKATSRLIAVPR